MSCDGRITLSNGGEYDVSKEPQVTNAKLLKITSDEIIITGFTKSDIIVNDIPIVISDSEKIDINLNVDVFGAGTALTIDPSAIDFIKISNFTTIGSKNCI